MLESVVSIRLLGRTRPSPKSKNVCQSMNRRGARQPPRRSAGSAGSVARGIEDQREELLRDDRVALVPKLAR